VFLDQPHDTNGLVYLNNRYHDPQLGAFISVDPLVGQTGMPYLYGDGSPVTLSDPSGLCIADVYGARERCSQAKAVGWLPGSCPAPSHCKKVESAGKSSADDAGLDVTRSQTANVVDGTVDYHATGAPNMDGSGVVGDARSLCMKFSECKGFIVTQTSFGVEAVGSYDNFPDSPSPGPDFAFDSFDEAQADAMGIHHSSEAVTGCV